MGVDWLIFFAHLGNQDSCTKQVEETRGSGEVRIFSNRRIRTRHYYWRNTMHAPPRPNLVLPPPPPLGGGRGPRDGSPAMGSFCSAGADTGRSPTSVALSPEGLQVCPPPPSPCPPRGHGCSNACFNYEYFRFFYRNFSTLSLNTNPEIPWGGHEHHDIDWGFE